MSREDPPLNELLEQLTRRLRSIRIQETEVLNQIERATARAARELRAGAAQEPAPVFDADGLPTAYRVGDRVSIINPSAGQVPHGTVTRVTPERVSITLDNGIKTYRLRKNVTLVD